VRIGIFFPTKEYAPLDEMVARFADVAAQGFSSLWLPQSAGFDALTVLAVAGSRVPRVELGTSVIPTYPRHPIALAAQALTVNAATGGRLGSLDFHGCNFFYNLVSFDGKIE
jgi:alkanesulfonate monooxygenase SsuD/methylene tetrahydromethanopterin reductase-like flavin-dependent oxidoreductase (luciferase family)